MQSRIGLVTAMSDVVKVAVDLRKQSGIDFSFSFEYIWVIKDGEREGNVLYAIDVPPNAPIKPSLLGFLEAASSEGKWEYEESGTEPFAGMASE